MVEIATAIIGKLTANDLRIIIFGAAAVYLWLCLRAKSPMPFRKDKKGRWYTYSSSYQAMKNRSKKGEDILIQLQRGIKRLEFLEAVYHTPEAAQVIEQIYAEYKKINGNSYICHMYNEWQKKYELETIKERI